MGYIRHDAIVVTSWSEEAISAAAKEAARLGLQVLGPSGESMNGYRTILVCPDGSKEGWRESHIGDERRRQFIDYLDGTRHSDGSSSLEWVAIAYGSDDGGAEVTAHAWENQGEEDGEGGKTDG